MTPQELVGWAVAVAVSLIIVGIGAGLCVLVYRSIKDS